MFTHARARLGAAVLLILSAGLARAQIDAGARTQIAELIALKDSFSPAEKKMSSNLVFASRQARGLAVGAAAGKIDTAKAVGGVMPVEIGARVSARLTAFVAKNAARVESVSAQHGRLRANVPLASLHLVAEDADVLWIREPSPAVTNVGALTSQGFIAHTAKPVIAAGIDGTGVKVGVLSDSALPARIAALKASGDLGPNTTVLAGQDGPAGSSDEGAAMMEIVQDIAPGAQVFFATAFTGEQEFADNITALGAAGCTVIVDDISYFDEGAFQDGIIAQSVNTFVAGGGVYFSSAANSGNLTDGTSGTWEGDFLDGGVVSPPVSSGGETGNFHNFGTAGVPQLFDALPGSSTFISLKWADPLGGSTNDYDLFVLNSTGSTVKAFSMATQNGTQDPFEFVQSGAGYTPAANDRIVLVRHSGAAVALRVDTHRGRLAIGTAGSTYGHNGGAGTTCVAATDWNSARIGTHRFSGPGNPIETFSSDGPRKIFFKPDGTPVTPGNFLFATNGGVTLQKPDITAADGVSCKTPGFLPFFGTSAAAPHAAGIAALVKSAKPSLTGAKIKQILIDTALDNMADGPDRDGGAGVLNAEGAVAAALGK